ncbi:hypothetical protein V8E54_006104 [Elaphomyces granulatus]
MPPNNIWATQEATEAMKAITTVTSLIAGLFGTGSAEFNMVTVPLRGGELTIWRPAAQGICAQIVCMLEAPKLQTIQQAFPQGLEYRSPQKGTLLATDGALWQYQPSVNLRCKLRKTVSSHYRAYRNADKMMDRIKKCPSISFFFRVRNG